MTAMEVTNNK